MIEDPAAGAMLESQFGSRTGNLCKPDGPAATWATFDRESFPKKSNEDDGDFNDIESAIRALHAPRTDARAWRSGLETRFDADLFLRWLAINTAIQNWDAYGAMPHNYYLYADPAQKGRLRWIPWDHNFSRVTILSVNAFCACTSACHWTAMRVETRILYTRHNANGAV